MKGIISPNPFSVGFCFSYRLLGFVPRLLFKAIIAVLLAFNFNFFYFASIHFLAVFVDDGFMFFGGSGFVFQAAESVVKT